MKLFTVFYITPLCEYFKEMSVCIMKKNYLNAIHDNLNLLSLDQLQLLFEVYHQLNYHCNFFMSEESYKDFINLFLETPCNRNPLTYKTLINLLITQYTPKNNYLSVLEAIEMILNNYPLCHTSLYILIMCR